MPSPVPGRHAGKCVVVTGGARGIGLAYAQRFAAEGARLVLGDVLDREGEAAAASLGAGVALYRRCDVTKKAEVEALMDAAVSAFGRLDIAVANAGIEERMPFLETTEESFDRVMAVNVKGTFLAGQAAARRMIACGNGGVVIAIASTNAMVVNMGQTAYAASKAAIALLIKVMAVSLADHGIRALALAPNSTRTEMLDNALKHHPTLAADIRARTPLRRPAEVEEIAAVASFLASDDASYMTGQTVYVDGGRLVLNYMMPD